MLQIASPECRCLGWRSVMASVDRKLELLLLPLPSCLLVYSILVWKKIFPCSIFQSLSTLSRSVSVFVILGRYWWGKGSLLVWGLTKKLRSPSGLFVSVLFRVCFLSLSNQPPFFRCSFVYIEFGGW